jgi:hypothetical protein
MPKFVIAFLFAFFCLGAPAFAQENPYIGVWDVSHDNIDINTEQNVGARSIEFTEKEILFKLDNVTINSLPVTYKKDSRGDWYICLGDNVNCAILPIHDGKMEFPPEKQGDHTEIYTKRQTP